MSAVIRVENISKHYRLGSVGTGTLSHDLNRWWAMIRGKEDPFLKIGEVNERNKKGVSDYVWALKNIDFEVLQGDILGIIGKNGAGKSTVLKILSRVTAPTTGEIKIKGRIASLLEVGTGFHPELTGKENIYLNGAILGMTKSEIKSKFDEIVDFSGVERYIDTPVKRYSSGMYVRLAFAVAAHLEPEILIVDEVLAVGDQEFQDKCIGKMKDVSGSGRTVLFVSHNMTAIKALCSRAILLENGKVSVNGSVADVIEEYLSNNLRTDYSGKIPEEASVINTGQAKFSHIFLKNSKNEYTQDVFFKSSIKLFLHLNVYEFIRDAIIDVRIATKQGVLLTHSMNKYEDYTIDLETGNRIFEVTLQNDLQPGNYSITIGVHYPSGATIEFVENILDFRIHTLTEEASGDYPYPWIEGHMRVKGEWKKIN